jgi:molybdate transport system substrate-binding protein
MHVGLWDRVKGKLVYGENVQQTLQFAQSGNAEVALVALSLALHADGSYWIVDEADHPPIDQALVACGKDPVRQAVARRFIELVRSPRGRNILRGHGFIVPDERNQSP